MELDPQESPGDISSREVELGFQKVVHHHLNIYRSGGCRSFCCCCHFFFFFSSVGKQLEQAYLSIATLLPLPPSVINRMWFMWMLMGTGQCKNGPKPFLFMSLGFGCISKVTTRRIKKICCHIILTTRCHGINPRWPPNTII